MPAFSHGSRTAYRITISKPSFRKKFGAPLDVTDLERLTMLVDGLGLKEGSSAETQRRSALNARMVGSALLVDKPRAPDVVRARFPGWLAKARRAQRRWKLGARPIRAVVSPHIDLDLAGDVSTASYASLTAETWPDVFIVIGTSHFEPAASVWTRDAANPVRTRCR